MGLFTNVFPNFGKGRILKKEMLENLRDYPRNFLDIYYKDFSDGIISGTDIKTEDGKLVIGRGIVKFAGRIYMLEEDVSLPYHPSDREAVIKIRFLDESAEEDFCFHRTRIFIDDNCTLDQNEMELGRFTLQEGARLRLDYENFSDFSTRYNVLNIIHVQYSGWKKGTLSPVILRYFAQIALGSRTERGDDVAFAMQCLNQEYMGRDVILYYISRRLGIEHKDYSNQEIYKHFAAIIKKLESGSDGQGEVRKPPFRKIIVD